MTFKEIEVNKSWPFQVVFPSGDCVGCVDFEAAMNYKSYARVNLGEENSIVLRTDDILDGYADDELDMLVISEEDWV